jgi:hypothetical protein
LLSTDTLPLTNSGLELLKRNEIWIGDTGATMHSAFCDAHRINKRAIMISTTDVSSRSIKPLLQIELDCIAWSKKSNVAGTVQLGNVVLLEPSNYNLLGLSELLNYGWKMHGGPSKIVMANG